MKETLHVRHYIRYMDDFVILSPDKAYLRDLLQKIEFFLASELGLLLNPKTTILNCKNGVDFCGYRHFTDHKKVRKTSIRRMKRTIRAYRKGIISEALRESPSKLAGAYPTRGRVLASGRNASTAGGRAGRAASRKRGGTNRQ